QSVRGFDARVCRYVEGHRADGIAPSPWSSPRGRGNNYSRKNVVRFRRRLISVLVPITIIAVLGAAATLWLDQQSARARLAEAQLEPALARAQAAEARAARAEASLTQIAEQRVAEAGATATAVARVNEPK